VKKQALQQQPGPISVLYEIAKQKKDKIPSDFLQDIRKTLRTVLSSRDYTLDASSVLKQIDVHPESARRILDFLSPCSVSGYERFDMLFNFKEIVKHTENQDIAQIERDLRLLKNKLKKILGDEREVKYWGRKVDWAKSVTIPVPSFKIRENYYGKDRDQRNYSLEKSSIVVLDRDNEIQVVMLQVLETGSPRRHLFTIVLDPKQKSYGEKKVRIFLHDHSSKASQQKQLQSNYSEIPVHIENRGKGLCVFSTTDRSVIRGNVSGSYLNFQLNDNGQKKWSLFERRIGRTRSDSSLSNEEKNDKVRRFENMKSRLINKRQYQSMTIRTNGLLLYSLVESDYEVFNEVVENISKCNRDDVEDFDPYYDEKIWVPFQSVNHLDQVRRKDFPFLLDYYKFSHVLPLNFAFDVLRRIAEEFQSRLETISPSKLKFEVTSRFFAEVREFLWRKPIFGILKIEYVDNKTFTILSNYHSMIGLYVRRKQKLISALVDCRWGKEISYNRLRLREKSSKMV
jgi:hypothetical protein